MRKHVGWLVGAAFAALATTLSAQPVSQNQLSGNECWSVGQGPGGPSQYLCINVARGGTANLVTTVTGAVTIGGVIAAGGNMLVTAQPSAAVITMPPNPVPDGAIVGVCNTTAAAWVTNAVTLSANTGQTLAQTATLTTLAAGTCAREQWNQATATWYRVQ
jgi:hypothetical protein